MFIIYVIDSSTKNKMYKQGFIFLQNQKYRRLEIEKKFFSYFISEIAYCILHLQKMHFFQKMLSFSSEHSFKAVFIFNFFRS